MKRTYYLIDTENVGDRWLDLPGNLGKKDRLIIFYTENHSKKMEECLVTQLHNPHIMWLECTTGNNALDYQLMGVLSYLIARRKDASYCILSNDKGYQDTVDYWKARGIRINQKGYSASPKKKEKNKAKEKKNKKPAVNKSLSPEELTVLKVAQCLPVTDLQAWNQTLLQLLGPQAGQAWYQKLKKDTDYRTSLAQNLRGDASERGTSLIRLLLMSRQLPESVARAKAKTAYQIIRAYDLKNLNAIKVQFDKSLEEQPAWGYYRLLRPYFHIIKRLSE